MKPSFAEKMMVVDAIRVLAGGIEAFEKSWLIQTIDLVDEELNSVFGNGDYASAKDFLTEYCQHFKNAPESPKISQILKYMENDNPNSDTLESVCGFDYRVSISDIISLQNKILKLPTQLEDSTANIGLPE